MKKTLRLAGAGLLLALTPAIVACSDDEPNNSSTSGGINNGGSGDIESVEGLKLTSINNIQISYDDLGRVSGFRSSTDRYDYATIDYDNGTIRVGDDDVMGDMKIKFNSKGYVSELNQSWNYSDYEESYKGSAKITFSYDGSNHLTKIHATSNETYRDDDGSGKYSEEVTYTLNWKGGNLVSAKCVSKENEDGNIDQDTETYNLTYSNLSNPFRQVTYGVYDYVIDSEEWGIFGCAGLLGVGSENLANEITYRDEYDGDSYRYSLSYDLNNNGTISYEKRGTYTFIYGYNYFDTRADNAKPLSLKKLSIAKTYKDRKAAKANK